MSGIKKLPDVVNWRLCLGCGACAYICSEKRVELRDYLGEGIRPKVLEGDCGSCRKCLDCCPVVQSSFNVAARSGNAELGDDFTKQWGPVTGIWEGHAADEDIRFRGASGGALTAISAYCLEILGMHGVLQVAKDPDDPIRNCTVLSRTRAELVSSVGSRYSPGSVCNGLGLVERSPAPCVVVGRPVEIAAVQNTCRVQSSLSEKVGLTLSFFCAEAPATQGTVALLEKLGVKRQNVSDLRYRGMGWPGHFAPILKGETQPVSKIPYFESWGFLQAYRPWAAQLWPDGSGELADITCGDPWYEKPDGKNPGFSLVVARTQRGKEIVEGAMAAGYLVLKPAEKWKLEKSQSGLLSKKGSVWGRCLALRCMGLPVTRFQGLDLWHCWRRLSIKEKIKSIFGTFRRAMTRKLYRPMTLNASDSVLIKSPRVAAVSVEKLKC